MGFPWRKIISLCKLVSDLRPIDILTEEIAVEMTEVVGVSPALWYFRYIASIFLTLHKRLCIDTVSSMPINPSKSRDLADENNKILTEWKWFETTVLKRIRRNLLGVDIVQIFVIMNSCIFISCIISTNMKFATFDFVSWF